MDNPCSGINWWMVARVAFGWVITLVVVGSLSAGLFSFAVYSPSLLDMATRGAIEVAANVTMNATM